MPSALQTIGFDAATSPSHRWPIRCSGGRWAMERLRTAFLESAASQLPWTNGDGRGLISTIVLVSSVMGAHYHLPAIFRN